jgi:hypothetical protein
MAAVCAYTVIHSIYIYHVLCYQPSFCFVCSSAPLVPCSVFVRPSILFPLSTMRRVVYSVRACAWCIFSIHYECVDCQRGRLAPEGWPP